jgi:radical SAM protein with 4Fe4S-binding SPASM domain
MIMAASGTIDPAKLLATPLQVTWTITARCNLRCSYCLESSARADAPEESTGAQRGRVIDEIISAKVLKVYLSGGEPLLVDGVASYVARLRQAGISVRLTTNCTLVDDGVAASLADAGLTAAEVSLQPGTAEMVARGMQCLVARGIRTLLRVVVTPDTADAVESTVETFIDSGVESIGFQEVMPLGRAARDIEAGLCDVRTLERVQASVNRMRARWGADKIGLTSTTLTDAQLGHQVPCMLGTGTWKSCEIRPDGNVIPCAPAAVFGIANSIYEYGLAESWKRLPELYAPVVAEDAGGRCADCASTSTCRGGCRAVCHLLDGPGGGNPACRMYRSGQ